MLRVAGWLWKTLAVLVYAAYQYLVHWTTIGGEGGLLRVALVWLPLLALGWWVATRPANKLLWWTVLALACGGTYLLEHQERLGLAAAYGIPHAASYVFLLWFFGRTLLPGRVALITRLARRVHGTLAPEMESYTRRVTLAWCVFFVLQVIASALLFQFASLEAWSLFINVLNLPLVALMFVVEYGYRVTRYRDHPQASIAQAIQAFVKDPDVSPGADVR